MLSGVERECTDIVGIDRVADKTSRGMSIETDHKKEGEVVGCTKMPRSIAYGSSDVGGPVHQDHHEEHEVTGDTARLGVVYIQSGFLSNLCIGNQLLATKWHGTTYECALH